MRRLKLSCLFSIPVAGLTDCYSRKREYHGCLASTSRMLFHEAIRSIRTQELEVAAATAYCVDSFFNSLFRYTSFEINEEEIVPHFLRKWP